MRTAMVMLALLTAGCGGVVELKRPAPTPTPTVEAAAPTPPPPATSTTAASRARYAWKGAAGEHTGDEAKKVVARVTSLLTEAATAVKPGGDAGKAKVTIKATGPTVHLVRHRQVVEGSIQWVLRTRSAVDEKGKVADQPEGHVLEMIRAVGPAAAASAADQPDWTRLCVGRVDEFVTAPHLSGARSSMTSCPVHEVSAIAHLSERGEPTERLGHLTEWTLTGAEGICGLGPWTLRRWVVPPPPPEKPAPTGRPGAGGVKPAPPGASSEDKKITHRVLWEVTADGAIPVADAMTRCLPVALGSPVEPSSAVEWLELGR